MIKGRFLCLNILVSFDYIKVVVTEKAMTRTKVEKRGQQ